MKTASLIKFTASAILLGTIAPNTLRSSPQPESFTPEIQKSLESVVNKELAAFGGTTPVPGAVVAVWAPGKGTWIKGVGYSNLTPKTAMALDDKFRIGSNTKTFVI